MKIVDKNLKKIWGTQENVDFFVLIWKKSEGTQKYFSKNHIFDKHLKK